MGKIVNVHEAKTHLSRLLEDVRTGHEVVIAKAGKPVAKLVAAGHVGKKRPMGFVAGRLTRAFFAPLPKEELAAWQ
jgi:prevent-host-death family protein